MNAIVGFAQLLRRDQRAPLPPHQQGWAQQILRGAEHLLELINEVLDLGRIEAGRLLLELSPVSVQEVVNDSQAFVRELARSHGVRLLPAEGLTDADGRALMVMADRTRLRQVLLNLLGNAIKYNRPDGHVQVHCQQVGDQVHLAVRDSGRGLDAQQLQGLFQPFERLGAERGEVEGTGIGLALSMRLVRAMGGDLLASSQAGQGSTFTACIPAAPRAPAAQPAQQRQRAPAAAPDTVDRTVLYIDDNEVNVLLVETLLADTPGLRFISAYKPTEGLKLAQRERPSLVLLDIHMPEMDGYEVLARLRSMPATAGIPVVAVSADAMPTDLDAAKAAGFSAYLTKPLDFEQLLQTVHRLSQERQNP
jgi:CheY-like chemotaxis protein